MMDRLERQQQIIRCIQNWIADTGDAPSVREIAHAVGLSSPATVVYHLKRMEEQGLVTRGSRRQWRSYRPHW